MWTGSRSQRLPREIETNVNIFHTNETPYKIFSPNMILGIVAKQRFHLL